MKGSKEQSFWIGFGLVMVVLTGASGFYLFTAIGKYKDAQGGFEVLAGRKRSLEGTSLYPKAEHVTELQAKVDAFEKAVDTLHEELKGFQKPLESVSDQQFPQILRSSIERFEAYARDKAVIIPENFYFGMNEYETSLPRQTSTGILKYQLDSMEHLLRVIIESGADEILDFQRERTAVETAEPDPEATERVVKYTTKVSFQTTHEGFREFLNQVSNDQDYFLVVRVLRVDNMEKLGPSKDVVKPTVYRDPVTGQVVVQSEIVDERSLVVEDASVIFGDEKLIVTAVIDLCRFPSVSS